MDQEEEEAEEDNECVSVGRQTHRGRILSRVSRALEARIPDVYACCTHTGFEMIRVASLVKIRSSLLRAHTAYVHTMSVRTRAPKNNTPNPRAQVCSPQALAVSRKHLQSLHLPPRCSVCTTIICRQPCCAQPGATSFNLVVSVLVPVRVHGVPVELGSHIRARNVEVSAVCMWSVVS